MTEEEAKAAVIAAAEEFVDQVNTFAHKGETYQIGSFTELVRCVTEYRKFQRRVFLVAHGEHANISFVYQNGHVTAEYPAGEFTEAEETAIKRMRTSLINTGDFMVMLLLPVFKTLERVGPWPL